MSKSRGDEASDTHPTRSLRENGETISERQEERSSSQEASPPSAWVQCRRGKDENSPPSANVQDSHHPSLHRLPTERIENRSTATHTHHSTDNDYSHCRHHGDASGISSMHDDDDDAAKAWEDDEEQHPPLLSSEEEPSTIQDRIAASALAGTLELLKLAGGVTLNTTGRLVAPPIHVVRTVLLPVLWHALVDTVDSKTPDRVKDWFRIISSSVRHFFSVLRHTQRGIHFRGRLIILLSNLVDVLVSDTTRQLLMDGTASLVKLAELLHTPEFHAWTEQTAVWGCRLVQALANGANQELIHNFATVVTSGAQLLADPHTTLALAEVTAYLCHALEMQETQQQLSSSGVAQMSRDEEDTAPGATTTTTTTSRVRQKRAQRRHERNQYQTSTHVDRVTITNQPTATVEQVILSSLGVPDTASRGGDGAADVASVPSRIAVGDDDDNSDEKTGSVATAKQGSDVDWNQPSSIRQQVDDDGQQQKPEQQRRDEAAAWHEQARKVVDVEYLRERIDARAEALVEERNVRKKQPDFEAYTTNQGDVEDSYPRSNGERSAKAKKKRISIGEREAPNSFHVPTIAHPMPKEGETPVAHFNRVLNEILESKRSEVIQGIEKSKLSRPGSVNLHRRGVNGASEQKPRTIKERLLSSGVAGPRETVQGRVPRVEDQRLAMFILSVGAFVVTLWFGLGCYGLYAIVYSQSGGIVPRSSTPITNEVVVRVIRQVVHVDAIGNNIGTSLDDSVVNPERYDQIADCVADAVD